MWFSTTFNTHVSFSFWTIHWATNGWTLGFHWSIYTINPFQHALWHDIWNPLCLNFIMFWPWGRHLVYNLTNFLSLSIIFHIFFHNALDVAWITTSFNYKLPMMCAHTSHRFYWYSPFMLHPWQQAYRDPWYSLQHLCHHCVKC